MFMSLKFITISSKISYKGYEHHGKNPKHKYASVLSSVWFD
jgi:hypothetical protein